MKIIITSNSGHDVLAISGEVDMDTSPELRTHLLEFIHKRTPLLLIDFREVSYIDSSGIATFVEGLKGMMVYGGKLKFVAIPEKIGEIFSFAKLDRVFEIYGSIEDALHR
ncbi:MAG: anti-sigma factor antagonist [Nitrospirae bacterium]|nr:MAG: anti-sigma factor antagonist [Nitrospirota bacterium]